MKNNSLHRMPRFIILLAMLYVITFVIPIMLGYRMVHLGWLLEPGGTLIFPASYFFGDIIAEVYGYQLVRQLIWSALFCQMALAIFITVVLHLPYPHYWHEEIDFQIVLGHSLRYAFASTIGNFFGEFVNAYLITKCKILLKGRFFWLRSLGSTCFGELALTIVVFIITFSGITSNAHVMQLVISAYLFKVIFAAIAVVPASYLVKFLKRAENIDVYDYSTNFNPFKFSIEEKEETPN